MKPICAIEPLEARSLMSVAADAVAELPSVRLLTRSVVSGGTGLPFQLVVSSPAGLARTPVGDDVVLVGGPRGCAGGRAEQGEVRISVWPTRGASAIRCAWRDPWNPSLHVVASPHDVLAQGRVSRSSRRKESRCPD